MGTFFAAVQIGDTSGSRFEAVEAMADTGATYTMMPETLLRSLGVSPIDTLSFLLANGESVRRDIGETTVRIGDRVRTTLVVFSGDESHPILGAYTLEAFSLAVDPVNQRLITVQPLAMTAARAPDYRPLT